MPGTDTASSIVRLRLAITYDGTEFSGWAVQPGRRTVAGVLGEALTTLLREPVPMTVAGRTDAGVHAAGQVAHIDVDRGALLALSPRRRSSGNDRATPALPTDPLERSLVGLRRRLAGLLPADVRVPDVAVAPDGFDARFAAMRRHYRYRIIGSEWGVPPLVRLGVLHWRKPLDAPAMQRAADGLIGLHDFAAYCKPREGGTTIRDLQRLAVTGRPLDDGDGTEITVDVSADAFCHSMVRSLVGALLVVGEGRAETGRPAELLAARRRTAEIAVAPARGLTLLRVDYPADADLADRVHRTRAVRCEPCAGGGPE